MIAPSKPPDEIERLADLHATKLLDTDPEERFDRITRLAANVLETPIAYIALVDTDRQWFKSTCGLDANSTSRDVSFCGHTILSNVPLIIPDTLLDDRFRDNPLVTSPPGIRFYAGHPLRGPRGKNIGTLCLADRAPRPADSVSRDLFHELASFAEHEFQLHDLLAMQRQLLTTKNELIEMRAVLAEEIRQAEAYVRSLLPTRQTVGELVLDAAYIPSTALAGDFVNYITLPDGRIAAYLLDVTGHGVAAALLAVSMHDFLRFALLNTKDRINPGEILTAVNQNFQTIDHNGRFATAWLGIIDPKRHSIEYSAAGHHPATLWSADRTPIGAPSDATGLPLGIIAEETYQTDRIALQPGDQLFVYSDGLFEAHTTNGGMLGRAGLLETLTDIARSSDAEHVVERISSAAEITNFDDDVSLLIVQRRE